MKSNYLSLFLGSPSTGSAGRYSLDYSLLGRARAAWRAPLLANSFYLLANSGIAAAVGFLFWIVVARLYPAEQVGLGSALISAASFLSFIGALGLGFGLIRYLPGAGPRAGAWLTSHTLVALAFLPRLRQVLRTRPAEVREV